MRSRIPGTLIVRASPLIGAARRMRRSRRRLKTALQAATTNKVRLPLLLELDDRFAPDTEVLHNLAVVHRQLGLHHEAQGYLHRARALDPGFDDADLAAALEVGIERWGRTQARLQVRSGNPEKAVKLALGAAQGESTSTWTVRVLVESAIASGRQDDVRATVYRIAEGRPDDAVLQRLKDQLDD